MSAGDDVRKLLQDFLAPELRAISVRLDAVEARLAQTDTQRQHDKEELTARLTHDKEELTARMAHDKLDLLGRLDHIDAQRQRDKEDILRAIQTLSDYRSLAERPAQVESRLSAHQ